MVRGGEIRWLFIIVPLLLVISCEGDNSLTPDCYPDRGECVEKIGKGRLVFEISPRPVQTMKELLFRVKLASIGSDPDRVLLDLSMPGMEMGKNQIILERKQDGIYEGRGTIVRCPSGRKLWRASIWVPGHGEVQFVFEVK